MYFYSTLALACISLALAIALCIALLRKARSTTDPRLLGTWISDAQRTMKMLPASADSESEAFRKTSMLLGKMKITFSPTEIAIDLDGQIDRSAYRVLASDEYSCVIEEVDGQPKIESAMQLSTFNVIHFEDQNSYWVLSQYGGFAEYFRRLRE